MSFKYQNIAAFALYHFKLKIFGVLDCWSDKMRHLDATIWTLKIFSSIIWTKLNMQQFHCLFKSVVMWKYPTFAGFNLLNLQICKSEVWTDYLWVFKHSVKNQTQRTTSTSTSTSAASSLNYTGCPHLSGY